MALEDPRAERRERAEQARRGEPQAVAGYGGAHEHAEQERPGQVDRERPRWEAAGGTRRDGRVDQQPSDRAQPAEQAHAGQDERAHATSLARRTRPLASPTAAKPAMTLPAA